MLIDFHSHILPECDHGSDSVETSLRLLRQAREAGIGTVVATPHFYMYKDTVDEFISRREHSYRMLIEAADSAGLNIHIVKAAEVALFIDLPNLPDLKKLCVEGTNYMLLEISGYKWARWVNQSLSKLISRHNIIPVIAHIDRYDAFTVRRLSEMNVPLQINAQALIPVTRRSRYMKMVKCGAVHVLGSDAHSSAGDYEKFAKAVKILGRHMDDLNRNVNSILKG